MIQVCLVSLKMVSLPVAFPLFLPTLCPDNFWPRQWFEVYHLWLLALQGPQKGGRWWSFLACCLVAACKDQRLPLAFQGAFLYREGDLRHLPFMRVEFRSALPLFLKPALGAELKASSLDLGSKEIKIEQYCLNINEFHKYVSELSDWIIKGVNS